MHKQFIGRMIGIVGFGIVLIAGIGYFTPALWQNTQPFQNREEFVEHFISQMPQRNHYLIQPAYDSYLEQKAKDILSPFIGEEYVRTVVHTELSLVNKTIEREKIISEKNKQDSFETPNAADDSIKQKTISHITSFHVKRADAFVFFALPPDKERTAFFKSKKDVLLQNVQRVIGIDPNRGDTFQAIDFPETVSFAPAAVQALQFRQITAVALICIAFLGILMFVLLPWFVNRKTQTPHFKFTRGDEDENMYRNQIIGNPEENLLNQARELCFQMPEVAINALRNRLYDTSSARTSSECAFSPAQQAAIILLCLGDKGVRLCFKGMSEEEIKTLSRIMAGLGRVKAIEIHPIIVKFCRQMRQPQDIVAPLAQTKAYIRNALPAERAAQLLKELEKSVAGRTVWEKINKVSDNKIAAFLSREYPQTAAEILYHLPTDKAARIISLLSLKFASETLLRLCSFHEKNSIKPSLLELVGNTKGYPFKTALSLGEAKVAAVLSLLSESMRKRLLDQLRLLSPQGADLLSKQLITFDDFALWDEEDLSVLLKHVDEKTLIIALANASNSTKEKFSRVINPQKWGNLLREIAGLPSGSIQKIGSSQQAMLQIAHQLIDAHKCKGKLA